MITKIIERLKTGTIKNIVPFGEFQNMPSPPYVVVKPERGINGTRNFRIITHYEAGYITDLEDYVFNELSTLLKDYSADDRHGNTFKLIDSGEYTDILAVSDDKTISMERIYFTPFRVY